MDYIWITRWADFQHYKPEPDRPPAWIKDYTKQLDDERYLVLTDRQRALLRDLRDVFAIARGRLRYDRAMIARRRNCITRQVDLETLNHAGFIDIVSRDVLDKRLELLYASRAPARSQREREVEEETPKPPFQETPNPNGRGPKRTGYRLVRGTHGISYVRDPHGIDTLPAGWSG